VLTLEFCEGNLAQSAEVFNNDCGCKTVYCPSIYGVETKLILWESGIYSDWI
jgi:hypothetical protein